MDDARLQQLVDREAIVDVMSRYARGVDRRDAAVYRGCFTEVLDVDMLGNPQPGIAADAWVEQALAAVSGFETTQHIITNHEIEIAGDTATCTAYVQAQHWRPDGTWLLGGHYDNALTRIDGEWRIHRLRLSMAWSERSGALAL